jgi:hypothetical protein
MFMYVSMYVSFLSLCVCISVGVATTTIEFDSEASVVVGDPRSAQVHNVYVCMYVCVFSLCVCVYQCRRGYDDH